MYQKTRGSSVPVKTISLFASVGLVNSSSTGCQDPKQSGGLSPGGRCKSLGFLCVY